MVELVILVAFWYSLGLVVFLPFQALVAFYFLHPKRSSVFSLLSLNLRFPQYLLFSPLLAIDGFTWMTVSPGAVCSSCYQLSLLQWTIKSTVSNRAIQMWHYWVIILQHRRAISRREVYRTDPREGRTRLIIQTITRTHSLSLIGHPLSA